MGHAPEYNCVYNKAQEGMSIRTYIATKAMQGLLSNHNNSYLYSANPKTILEDLVSMSWEIADKMIEKGSEIKENK